MIRIAIVEDETEGMEILKAFIERYCQKTSRQFTVDWFKNGLDFISDYQPIYDVIFMDILMPHLDGMQASYKLREMDKNVALIFVTNMMQFAIKGYEVNAIDFMVKPIKYYDFEMKLNKALDYAAKRQNQGVMINLGDVKKRIPLLDIYYIEVMDHTLIYHTKDGRYESRGRMRLLEEEFAEHNFCRCHNSYLINLRHVVEIHPDHLVVGGNQVPISRRRKKEFMQELTNYLGGGF